MVSGIRRLASEVWSLGLPLVLTMETQERAVACRDG